MCGYIQLHCFALKNHQGFGVLGEKTVWRLPGGRRESCLHSCVFSQSRFSFDVNKIESLDLVCLFSLLIILLAL